MSTNHAASVNTRQKVADPICSAGPCLRSVCLLDDRERPGEEEAGCRKLDDAPALEDLRHAVVRLRLHDDPVTEQAADQQQAHHQKQLATVAHSRAAARLLRVQLQLRCNREQ